jgi:hypothetical protein
VLQEIDVILQDTLLKPCIETRSILATHIRDDLNTKLHVAPHPSQLGFMSVTYVDMRLRASPEQAGKLVS